MIKDATADLEEHLQRIDEKLQSGPPPDATPSEEEEKERKEMEEERSSTEQCLDICARLSAHIDQIQPLPIKSIGGTRTTIGPPERITTDGIRKCKESLSDASALLHEHRQRLDDQLKKKSKTASRSEEDAAEFRELQRQRDSFSQCIDICAKASEVVVTERIVVIEDVNAAIDSCNILVSTIGDLISVKRVSAGDRSIQICGQTSNDTVQQVSRDHASRLGTVPATAEQQSGHVSGFRDRFGVGYKLSQPSQGGRSSSVGRKGDQANSSPNP